jgi:magnesium transporter
MGAAFGGLMVAVALSGIEEALRAVPVLALFMPVVAGMGGNVGTQSSTIVVRGLAVGYVNLEMLRSLVLREVSLGALLGVVTGLAVSTVAAILGFEGIDTLPLVGVLTGGLVGSMTIGAGVGAGIPLVLERMEIDPAVATGPFVTTAVDVLGLLFYFGLATALLEMPL